jgi:hypothetical protein
MWPAGCATHRPYVPWVQLFWSELLVVVVLVWLWRGCVLVRLPFRTVLSCEIGTAEGKLICPELSGQLIYG